MTVRAVAPSVVHQDGEISFWGLGSMLVRHLRTIVALALAGGVLGLLSGLASERVYTSTATFIPQGSEGSGSLLAAAAASQLGIRMPGGGGGAGPRVYVELLRSRALLRPIALDTVTVAEEGRRRIAVMDLLGIKARSAAERVDLGIRTLEGIISVSEVRALDAVKVSVTTPWPSVSLALANEVVRGVNQYNLETRKSQAAAERQFVETQVAESERVLRLAEDRLQSFLQRNRTIGGSPELGFERDRLQRDVTLRQELHTVLLKSREEARIREVRDTPVITVFEKPELPTTGEPRRSVQKAILGGIAGGLLGILIAFLAEGLRWAQRAQNQEAREFFQLVKETIPRLPRLRGK
jgi:uncharacterized protein involved in exopolysaccharide biosynthesis